MSLAEIFRGVGNEWLDDAVCGYRHQNIEPAAFDSDIWPGEGRQTNLDAMDRARGICAVCPVRAECGDAGMKFEVGLSGKNRYTFYAGLTPAQRALIEQRGDWSEAEGFKDRGIDPLTFNAEYAVDGVRPVSEKGSDWTDRHTSVARDILAWVSVTFTTGQYLPSYRDIARTVKARDAYVRRVLEALAEDGILRGTQKGYVLVASPRKRTWGAYLPSHLRESL